MLRGYIIRLYPNKAQQELLDKHFGCCRWVYNEMIVINQKKYHRTGQTLSGYDMASYLPKLKKQYPWLAEVNAASLQIVCHNLANAYNLFFKKHGEYPVFKKKGCGGSYTCYHGTKLLKCHLRLPKLGLIRYRGGDQPEGKIKRFTIRERAGKYYAAILVETPEQEPPSHKPDAILGLDLGVIDLIVTSAGQAVSAPKHFHHSAAKFRAANKALSRCQKGSKRRAKARLRLARVHEKVRNQRKDFHHKLSHSLVADNENQAFAIENLNVKGMMANRKLSAAIADCGWSQFLTFLRYKAAAVGKPVLEVDRWFPSSKTCSACGVVRHSLPLSIREWQCDACGCRHHRDVNAAINIALEAARNVACGDGVIPSVLRPVPVVEARMCA
jgi:putative transposase